ncbi:uncharacterized protein LOC131687679 [Topomyia yanbarensis]|uniref:uncharacterized protein LOC131687679 n=1 Tax=Topomyia yanbarensis TaxID=2498891 RepID=UPI00273BBB1B|nr:uncharacterized protein LOC131687679 [Topomyia yanbarensis]
MPSRKAKSGSSKKTADKVTPGGDAAVDGHNVQATTTELQKDETNAKDSAIKVFVHPPPSEQVNDQVTNESNRPGVNPKEKDTADKNKTNVVKRNPFLRIRKNRVGHCQVCDERDNSRMVQCDGCNEWYHFSCVEVSEGIADVSWICMNCEHAKDLTPSPLHTTNVSSTTSTVRSKSKASSIGSQAKRRQALELQWLEEEKELERRYLELKYKILLEGGSDCSSIVSEPQSVSISKVKKWIDDMDGYGEKVDCGSEPEGLEKRPPRNSTASVEHQAPVPDQQRATQVNIQLRRPPQRVSGQQETRPIFGSSHMRQSVALAPEAGSWAEANAFVPGQRSTHDHPSQRMGLVTTRHVC